MGCFETKVSAHTEGPSHIRLIVASIHFCAVQLTTNTFLKVPALVEGLVICIETDNVFFEVARGRTYRFAM